MKWVIILCVCFMCLGCTSFVVDKKQITEFNIWAGDLTEAKRVIYKANWLRLSGWLHGSFGNDLNKLPKETVDAIGEIDKIMKKATITDYDIWYICGTAQRAATPIITEWANKAIPYFGKDLVSMLRFIGWL